MKVQLVFSPQTKRNRVGGVSAKTWYPMGIAYLAASLRRDADPSLDLTLTDGLRLGYAACRDEILRVRPEVLGVSFLTPQASGAYALINEVRAALPGTLIVAGGVHATALPEDVLDQTGADLVVIGEGEATFREIVAARRDGRTDFSAIAGVAVRAPGGGIVRSATRAYLQPFDIVPQPAYDLVPEWRSYQGFQFRKRGPELPVMSARGCPNNCLFCANLVWKQGHPTLRLRSPEAFVTDLLDYRDRIGIREFFDVTDEFNSAPVVAKRICEEMLRRQLNLPWKTQVEAANLDEELVALMARAGCWYVHVGAESFNPRTLRGIGKRATPDDVHRACALFKKHGIKVVVLLMIFNFWEENGALAVEGVEETMHTLRIGRRMVSDGTADFIAWSPTAPYPGSRLYELALRHRLFPGGRPPAWEEWDNAWAVTVNLPGVTREDYLSVKRAGAAAQMRYLLKMAPYINWGLAGDLFGKGWGYLKSWVDDGRRD